METNGTDKQTPSETPIETEEKPAKKYAAEFLGTFVLVFMGCGSIVLAGSYVGAIGISFAFGLAFLAMVYAIGSISGCHINPAVTLSMFVAGKITSKNAVVYIIAQCVGAIFAAAALYSIALGKPGYDLALNGLGQNGYDEASPAQFTLTSAFVAEVLLTFIFILVIHGSTSEKVPKGFAGIPIGLSLVLIHLVGIPITGTSVNPARSLGPAIIVGGTALSQLWLFWVAPLIGGFLAAVVWNALK